MSTVNCSFWLVQRDSDSYIAKGRYPFEGSPNGTVEDLLQAARGHISPEEAGICDLHLEVHEVDEVPSPREFHMKLAKVTTPENKFYPHENLAGISRPQNLIVLYTAINISFAIFQKKPSSYVYLTFDSLVGSYTQNVAIIEAAARARLRALMQDGDSVGAFRVVVWDPQIPILPEIKASGTAKGLRETLRKNEDILNDAYFQTQCDRLVWSDKLTRVSNPKSLIVIASEQDEFEFDFGIFRRTSASFEYMEHGHFKGRGSDTVRGIEGAARECVHLRYDAADVGDICVYEPHISYSSAYNASLTNLGSLKPDGKKLGASATRLPITHKIWEIDSKSLIVVFDTKIRYPYALYERKPESLVYVTLGSVKVSSGRTVKEILTAARGEMSKTYSEARVYTPWEGFEDALGRSFIGIIRMGEDYEHNREWDPARRPFLPPETPLLDLDPTQVLLVVFYS